MVFSTQARDKSFRAVWSRSPELLQMEMSKPPIRCRLDTFSRFLCDMGLYGKETQVIFNHVIDSLALSCSKISC